MLGSEVIAAPAMEPDALAPGLIARSAPPPATAEAPAEAEAEADTSKVTDGLRLPPSSSQRWVAAAQAEAVHLLLTAERYQTSYLALAAEKQTTKKRG